MAKEKDPNARALGALGGKARAKRFTGKELSRMARRAWRTRRARQNGGGRGS